MTLAARLAIDIGKTFTDIVLETPARCFTTKVLTRSDTPEDGVRDDFTLDGEATTRRRAATR